MNRNLFQIMMFQGIWAFALIANACNGWQAPPAPRTFVTAAQRADLRDYCMTGEGAASFAAMRREFDAKWLVCPLPPEPVNYGEPYPKNKASGAVNAWRAAQVNAASLTGIGEAATLFWLVTGEPAYLARAKTVLLEAGRWSPEGAAGLSYNDEAAFRFWRKVPFLYDQLRDELTVDERAAILPTLRGWGAAFYQLVKRDLAQSRRNSLENSPRSHSVRFVSAVGIAGLALLDDLPEARAWFDFAVAWYRDQFPPWGGDDGGWSEGMRYWETGVASEPARFQDALAQIGHPDAWGKNEKALNPFWRNTGYFAAYILQPYATTSFGDTSMNGKVRLDWENARFLQKLARVFGDGYLRSFADLGESRPAALSLAFNNYPSGMEYLISDYSASQWPLPPPADLSSLPPARWFRDIGWVSLHSAPGCPAEDIALTFVSSPYGSFSHSHAAQNAFVLSAFGEELAVNAGYREFHGSPHHDGYVRRTLSKNAILIGGEGQAPRSTTAVGRITRFEANTGSRFIWTTGDASAAYGRLAGQVLRDVVFIDRRYFVIRDTIRLPAEQPACVIDWLLHAETPIEWEAATQTAFIRNREARLSVALGSSGGGLEGRVDNMYPVPPDAAYMKRFKLATQSHLTVRTAAPAREHEIVAILWPESDLAASAPRSSAPVLTRADETGVLTVVRPDGKTDRVNFSVKLIIE